MEQRIITVYCLINEYLQVIGVKNDIREASSMSSALALELGMMQYNPLMKGFLD